MWKWSCPSWWYSGFDRIARPGGITEFVDVAKFAEEATEFVDDEMVANSDRVRNPLEKKNPCGRHCLEISFSQSILFWADGRATRLIQCYIKGSFLTPGPISKQ
jgi:hypothetical protein